jgi:dihydrolipoamide dehydrogenase
MAPNSNNHVDVLVVGAGSGLDIVDYAAKQGLKVALLEEGSLGGTCHNRGCIPSKMLIHVADVAEMIKGSKRFGIKGKFEGIDYN